MPRFAYVLARPDKPLVRDMAGGQGFGAGDELALPPLEGLYWATVAEEAGHESILLDLGHPAHLARKRELEGVDVLMVEVQLPSFDSDVRQARELKEASGARLFLRTFVEERALLREALERTEAEAILRHQNYPLLPRTIDGDTRAGTFWLEDGTLREEPPLPLHDPDSLPIPDRGLLGNAVLYSYSYPLLPGGPVATIKTSWGCPFPCGYYCPYPLGEGRAAVLRSPEHVVRELADLERRGLRRVLVRDATFTLDMRRVRRICELILEQGHGVNWWCETRIDLLDRELLELMVRAGCKGVNVGIETGDPALMANSLKEGLDEKSVLEFVETARGVGLAYHLLCVLGLPGETRETIRSTFHFLERLRPPSVNFTFATPYPGTLYHQDAKEYGWILQEGYQHYAANQMVAKSIFLEPEEMGFAMDRLWQFIGAYRKDDEQRAQVLLREVEEWADKARWPALTVVVPTHDRLGHLKQCLKHLERQTIPPHTYEVVVVDDGSRDGTAEWLEQIGPDLPFELRLLRQTNAGPARARNLAIEEARGEVLLFTGDDIYFDRDALKHHCAWHRAHPGPHEAVVGLVKWAPHLKQNDFMKWLDRTGIQYGFHAARHGEEQGYGFFYTSNLSVKASFLRKHGLFDEHFKHAAWEDIELGYRLMLKGLRVFYNGHAKGHHDHIVELERFVERQRIVGHYAIYVLAKHPDYPKRDPLLFRGMLRAIALSLQERDQGSVDQRFECELMKGYARGLREGFAEYGGQLPCAPDSFEDFICRQYDDVLKRLQEAERRLQESDGHKTTLEKRVQQLERELTRRESAGQDLVVSEASLEQPDN